VIAAGVPAAKTRVTLAGRATFRPAESVTVRLTVCAGSRRDPSISAAALIEVSAARRERRGIMAQM